MNINSLNYETKSFKNEIFPMIPRSTRILRQFNGSISHFLSVYRSKNRLNTILCINVSSGTLIISPFSIILMKKINPNRKGQEIIFKSEMHNKLILVFQNIFWMKNQKISILKNPDIVYNRFRKTFFETYDTISP